MPTPVKNAEYVFYVTLTDSATNEFKAGPTIAAGDFQISKDGGAYNNLTNLPTVSPAGSVSVKIVLTVAEMDAGVVTVFGSDIAGAEWDDVFIPVEIPIANTDLIYQALGGTALTSLTHDANLFDQIRTAMMVIESQRVAHTHQPIGSIFYVDPVNGDTHANGNRGGISDPYNSVQDCHDNAITDSAHDLIFLLSGSSSGATTMIEDVVLTKRYLFIRGPGRDFMWARSGNGDTITVNADGIELAGFQINTASVGSGNGVQVNSADFFKSHKLWFNDTRGHAIHLVDCDNFIVDECVLQNSGVSGSGHGISIDAGAGETSSYGRITNNTVNDVQGDGIRLDPTGPGVIDAVVVSGNLIQGTTGDGINVVGAGCTNTHIFDNRFGNNDGLDINDRGSNTVRLNNEQWATAFGGFVHINSVTGDDTNDGTPSRPVKTALIARDIAREIGVNGYRVVGSITITEDHERWNFIGDSANFNDVVNLNGQLVQESRFQGLKISGDASAAGSSIEALSCELDDPGNVHGTFSRCDLLNNFSFDTLVSRLYVFNNCFSQIAGFNRPTIDYGSAAVSHNVQLRNYIGGVDVINMAQGNLSIDTSAGTIDLKSTVTGGDIVIRGTGILYNNAGASVMVEEGFIDGLDFRLMKQIIGGKAVVSLDDQTITVYDEDDVTVLAIYNVSVDGRTRTRTV